MYSSFADPTAVYNTNLCLM